MNQNNQNKYFVQNRVKWKQAQDFAFRYMQRFTNNPYHDNTHMKEVVRDSLILSAREGIDSRSRYIISTAALFHDIIYKIGKKNNEERSARVAGYILKKIGYNQKDIDEIQKLILSTKMPVNPKSHLEKIICDADVDNLGREDFFEKSQLVRQELGISDDKEWYKSMHGFLGNHNYYTASAKSRRDKGMRMNLSELETRIEK
ncbi:MAG: hypothetical protein KKE98_00170 [Nanoarchaeota archaeon]|nr:hypothetical protein [Nanoarchaeota archaeon]